MSQRENLARAFDLSSWSYFLDFALVPIAAACLIWFASGSLSVEQMLVSVPAGVLVWTLAEYWIHRSVFHGATRFEPMHDLHHRLPKDMIGIASWLTFLGFGGVCVAVAIFAGWAPAAAFTAGFMAGYLFYCAIHVRIHHGDVARFGRYASLMHRHHVGHHRGGKGNFGVSTLAWDVVFGTYKKSG